MFFFKKKDPPPTLESEIKKKLLDTLTEIEKNYEQMEDLICIQKRRIFFQCIVYYFWR